MKTIVITGATSFLGMELIRELNHNSKIIAVCRKIPQKQYSLPKNIEVVFASMNDYSRLPEVIPSADVFINLAWEGTGHEGRNDRVIQKKNVINSLKAIIAAEKMGCNLFIESGSQAEYGIMTTETSEVSECHPISEYGKAKLQLQRSAFDLVSNLKIKYVHLRIFSLFGENDHDWTFVMSGVRALLSNNEINVSSCSQMWNFLYVKDAANLIVKLIDYTFANNKVKHEIFNVASHNTRPLKDFLREMTILTKSKSVINFGIVNTSPLFSLLPDTTKVDNAIGVQPEHTFEYVIKEIINNYSND